MYTAASDPNHFLGRPGEYTSKTAFADSRIHGQPAGVSAGASVEVFATSARAVSRAQYIQGILQGSPALGTEYDCVAGDVLLRVSGQLTPSQAGAYERALAKITGLGAKLVE